MEDIIIATGNEKKIKEFKELLKGYNVLSLKDVGFFEEIEENGETFLENAIIKAKALHDFLSKKDINVDVLADDSGLCVDSLGGAPGVYSARYSGSHSNFAENRKKLLGALKDNDKRDAHFVTVIVKMYKDGKIIFAEGRTDGKILDKETGDTSFGYDSIFYSFDIDKCFGEVTREQKNSVSHRARALRALIELEKSNQHQQ